MIHLLRHRIWLGLKKTIIADKEIVGKALGINDEGELIIKTDEGEKIIRTGEVSVRGLYGYV